MIETGSLAVNSVGNKGGPPIVGQPLYPDVPNDDLHKRRVENRSVRFGGTRMNISK